jgi:hypothetical protein
MPRAENKKPVGVPETVYNEMLEYAQKNKLFLFEVIVMAWEKFKTPKKRKK